MKQELSKREKILFFSAGLLVLLYLAVQFAILPLARRYVEGLQMRDFVIQEKADVQADFNNKSTIESSNKNADERFLAIKQQYPLLVPNEVVDTTLTNLSIKSGLSPMGFSIKTPSANSQVAAGAEEQDAAAGLFTVVNATMNVTGTYASITNLLDSVDEMQYIRVTNLNYTTNRQDETSNVGLITIDFELTYITPS